MLSALDLGRPLRDRIADGGNPGAKGRYPPDPAVRTGRPDIGFAPDSGRSDAYG
jgi:hypothetical protein